MGENIRTLESGKKVMVHDSAESHLRRKFNARHEAHMAKRKELHEKRMAKVAAKRARLIKGGVPAEKRAC